jgi:hypothetical protein
MGRRRQLKGLEVEGRSRNEKSEDGEERRWKRWDVKREEEQAREQHVTMNESKRVGTLKESLCLQEKSSGAYVQGVNFRVANCSKTLVNVSSA